MTIIPSSETQSESINKTVRIEAFSDAVFAIAITLLVLDIHVPEVEPGNTLMHSLAHEWPSLLALLIGFFTILICWINHHYMFQKINGSNSILLLLNGFKLLVVTLTPFATALLSKHIQTDWKGEAVFVYCLNFAFMGLAMSGIWGYAKQNGYIESESSRELKAGTQLYYFAGIYSLLILLVSYFSITICLILSGIMFVIYISPKQTIAWLISRSNS